MYLPQETFGSAFDHSEKFCLPSPWVFLGGKRLITPIASLPPCLFTRTFHVAVHSDAGWFFAQAQPLSSTLQHWCTLLHPPAHCLLLFHGQQNIFPFLFLLAHPGGYTVFPFPSWVCFPSLPFTLPFPIGVWYPFPPFFPFCCTFPVPHCLRTLGV